MFGQYDSVAKRILILINNPILTDSATITAQISPFFKMGVA